MQINPKGRKEGENRVLHGGCFFNEERYCRVACRCKISPVHESDAISFRIVMGVKPCK